MEEILCFLQKRVIDSQDDFMILKETRDDRILVKLLFKALAWSDVVVFPHMFI